ncbi:MAG: c-type cytochrome [Chitinophagaceae bacterium]
MTPRKPAARKLLLFILSFTVFSIINVSAQDGAAIFRSKCASCHILGKDATGPNLQGVVSRWDTREHLHEWIKNYSKAVAAGYPRAKEVINFASSNMTVFEGSITDAEIDAVIDYVDKWQPPVKGPENSGGKEEKNQNAVIFGVISLILFVITLILLQVNSNLKKLSDDAEGINRPEPVPFYRNKVYIAMLALLFFVVAGYYFSKAAIGLQRQKNYEPEQPIFYSHKVHAGINQISCLYCHGNAWESKSAAIPSVNVCMNCHKTISSYEKGPDLYRENGEKVNGTAEIAKLYKAAGFDPAHADQWDPSKAKPIEWTRIHNLPDHVYFNHSQHVRAGKVQCQTCHGEITAMDEVKQVSELSMGWCVNCHRNTKVDFNTDSTGNKFYSIYEKFHNDIKAHKMDSVTVKDIGGLECQKCHY